MTEKFTVQAFIATSCWEGKLFVCIQFLLLILVTLMKPVKQEARCMAKAKTKKLCFEYQIYRGEDCSGTSLYKMKIVPIMHHTIPKMHSQIPNNANDRLIAWTVFKGRPAHNNASFFNLTKQVNSPLG